jgi:hypothetical protein
MRPLLLLLNVTNDVLDYDRLTITGADGRQVTPDTVEMAASGALLCHTDHSSNCEHVRRARAFVLLAVYNALRKGAADASVRGSESQPIE